MVSEIYITNLLTEKYGDLLESHSMWLCISSLGIKPQPTYDNKWKYEFKNYNIDSTMWIYGEGNTIYEAAWNFYNNLKRG